jgi:hypothetical protein
MAWRGNTSAAYPGTRLGKQGSDDKASIDQFRLLDGLSILTKLQLYKTQHFFGPLQS